MSKEVPRCGKSSSCHDCDENEKCKVWNDIIEYEKNMSDKLLQDLPIIIKNFGVCGMKQGTIEDWKKKLEKLSFGC